MHLRSALTLAALLLLAAPSSATAGTYTIDDCPSAPVSSPSAGPWQVFGAITASKSACSGGPGDFIGPLGGEMPPGSSSGVAVSTPPGSGITIAAVSAYWYEPQSATGAHTYALAAADGTLFEQAFAPVDYTYLPDTHALPPGVTSLLLETYCSNDDAGRGCLIGSGSQTPDLKLYGSQITLEDNAVPTGAATGGALAGPGTVSGAQSLSYNASDPTSGVRRVTLLVDGQAATQQDYAAQCPYQNFLACPATVAGTLDWNTATVPSGAHEIALRVTSAAGENVIVDDHAVTTTNFTIGPGTPAALRGSANGTNAADQALLTAKWAKTRARRLTGAYGVPEAIHGRLTTAAGQPIVGALIDASDAPAYEGAEDRALPSPRTGPAGEWHLTLPSGASSGSLRFGYRSHVNDTVSAADAKLILRVRAGISLRISPRVARVGQRIYFSGVLHGGPVPTGGKELVLEASASAEWVQFETISTDRRGRFHASYRFRFPGPILYAFRVVSPQEADFPFATGASPRVAVHEL